MVRMDRPLLERLMERAEFELNTGCWLWPGGFQGSGYGAVAVRVDGKAETRRAHRLSWECHFGQIPADLVVCHKCDTPACFNPAHLFLGTLKENSQDMVRKGRRANFLTQQGEAATCAKLTEGAVLDIRKGEKTMADYARQYGVSAGAVGEIWKGKNWRHLHDGSRVRGPCGNAARAERRGAEKAFHAPAHMT